MATTKKVEAVPDVQLDGKPVYRESELEEAPEPEARTRGTNASPKTPLEEKFERQKRALQALTHATIEWGAKEGLNAAQVSALREALESLGWLPERRKG